MGHDSLLRSFRRSLSNFGHGPRLLPGLPPEPERRRPPEWLWNRLPGRRCGCDRTERYREVRFRQGHFLEPRRDQRAILSWRLRERTSVIAQRPDAEACVGADLLHGAG